MATKYKQNSKGLWQARVWDGTYNADGTKHRKSVYSSKSSRDLELKVAAIAQNIREGNVALPSDISFLDYSRHWLKVKKGMREKNTQRMYRRVINSYFAPLEGLRLADFKHSDLQGLINSRLDSPRSCQQIAMTAKQVLRMAVSDSYITQDAFLKITTDLAIPKYKAAERRALTDIEKEAIKTAAFTDRERAYVYLLYACGLRRGEALALTPFDFKFAPGESTVTINKTIIFDENTPEVKNNPKSDNGFRTIPIPDAVAGFLKEYVQGLSKPYLMTNIQGGDLMTKTGYNKMWKSIVKKMNVAAGGSDAFPVITGLTAHIFRHNYCSELCYKVPTISIKKVAYLLGDTEKMVMNVYSHIIEEKEDVQSVVNEIIAI
ncbi:MAG: site-specific integrase [Lachnospiraceae bacterium]|jgi:integrase|nr:site-specific integrase [Lachnospiraceae bacterium]